MNVIDRLLEDALDYVVFKKMRLLDIFGKFIVFYLMLTPLKAYKDCYERAYNLVLPAGILSAKLIR